LFGRQTRDRAEMPHIECAEWNAQPDGTFPNQRIEDTEFVAEMPLSERRKRTVTIDRSRPINLIGCKATIYIPQLSHISTTLHQFYDNGTWKAERRVIESAQPTECGEILTEDIDNDIGIA